MLVVKCPPASAGNESDSGLIPESRRSPRGRNGNPLQYSCLENSLDREVWWAMVHEVTKSWTRPSNWALGPSLPHAVVCSSSQLSVQPYWSHMLRVTCLAFALGEGMLKHVPLPLSNLIKWQRLRNCPPCWLLPWLTGPNLMDYKSCFSYTHWPPGLDLKLTVPA